MERKKTALDEMKELLVGRVFKHNRLNHHFLIYDITTDLNSIKGYDLTNPRRRTFDVYELQFLSSIDYRALSPDEAQRLAYYELAHTSPSCTGQRLGSPLDTRKAIERGIVGVD